MDPVRQRDIRLESHQLARRAFLLGNKRAFALSLPAAPGPTATQMHPHKWFGAYLYGRKFLEGQVVRLGASGQTLSHRQQIALNVGLTSARREYLVDGIPIAETYFVPDSLQAIACELDGDVNLCVEPEFDMRLCRALNPNTSTYTSEPIDNGVIVSNDLPAGRYDDASETFFPDPSNSESVRLYAAVQIVGESVELEAVPDGRRSRRVLFRKDAQRHRFLTHSASAEASDHAPLWERSTTQLYVPVRIHLRGHGVVLYGFGSSRQEALEQMSGLRDNLLAYQAQKSVASDETVEHATFECGDRRVDTAYVHVLSRLMDSLVARQAKAEDTALEKPSTMILAGNQYFHDSWKRDENIALGFMLALGFYDLARDVIADTWQLQDPVTGRLPQRIRAGESPPYHSSDGTLWALWRLYGYWRCTGDDVLLADKLPLVEAFFRISLSRTIHGMLPSGRTNSQDYLWETWMDTPHTPRDGFPVEIQMLWIACLRVFRPLLGSSNPELQSEMGRAEAEAWQTLQCFNIRGVPADSLDETGEARDLITPNPYFCFGVGLDLGAKMERSMRDLGRRQLAGSQGIATLARGDWGRVFSPEFLADRRNVRGGRMRSAGKFNYHRGVEWNWLAQFFVRAELKYGDPDAAWRRYLRGQVNAALDSGGIGGISELFDLSGTRGPEFQAWSMSGLLEALHAFGGVTVDVPDRHITVEPQLPAEWKGVRMRKWYGRIPFDVRYAVEDGRHELTIDFPWGEVPDASVSAGFLLPARDAVEGLDVALDGVPQSPVWWVERIAGTGRVWVRFRIPASHAVRVNLEARKLSRARRSA